MNYSLMSIALVLIGVVGMGAMEPDDQPDDNTLPSSQPLRNNVNQQFLQAAEYNRVDDTLNYLNAGADINYARPK
jgi:hypothetical protein